MCWYRCKDQCWLWLLQDVSTMSDILIAPWGNPSQWREVKYNFENCIVKSKSSLPVLVDCIKPSQIVIIVLDTLAKSGIKYDDVILSAETLCEEFIENELGINSKSIKIIVAPGVGLFPNGIFKGKMADYYAHILFKLIDTFSMENWLQSITIHLDLTHGMNFMPTLTYRALREISGILALTRDVKLKVYNSDPYVKESKELSINTVESTHVLPDPCRNTVSKSLRLLEPVNLTSEERRKLFKDDLQECKKYINHRELNAFLSSVVNGLPLVLSTFYPDPNDLKVCLNLVESLYKNYVHVSTTNGKLYIKRAVSYGNDFIVCTKAYLTAQVINIKRKSELSLRELHELRRLVFSKISKLDSTISYDLFWIIDKVVKNNLINDLREWVIFAKALGKDVKSPDFRNFLAHSGLERNILEIKYNYAKNKSLEESLVIRYNQKMLDVILDYSSKGLSIG